MPLLSFKGEDGTEVLPSIYIKSGFSMVLKLLILVYVKPNFSLL